MVKLKNWIARQIKDMLDEDDPMLGLFIVLCAVLFLVLTVMESNNEQS